MKKKVIVYGAGNMGMAVCSALLENDIAVKAIVDKGICEKKIVTVDQTPIPAIHPEKMDESDKNLDIVISITAVTVSEIRAYLLDLGAEKAYSAGDYLCEFYKNGSFTNCGRLDREQYENALKTEWDDNESDVEWRMACDWFFDRNEDTAMKSCFRPDREKYFPDFIRKLLRANDVMIDGAYLDGGYSKKFSELCNGTVYAFSLVPQEKTVSDLKNVFVDDRELASLSGDVIRNRTGLMKPFNESKEYRVRTVTLDQYVDEQAIAPTFIRAYSMSGILDLLMGARKTIEKNRPIIAANLAHYMIDLLMVPQFMRLYCRDYRFLFRMHSFQGNDCIIYAIPKERE
ncbi:hypothetical protein [[Clostridium] aminophilum]|uniref:hypothetical protein n=1 Tax=[Clostridium] aminophilum TaxID=1526 RepID=UPI0004E0DE19|nr:hypothetical protein [[Clostridium] aminophilum]